MWNATPEHGVTAESPKGSDCQSMKMDRLIYVFANFSSGSLPAAKNSGLTLQTRNCHLDAGDISPLPMHYVFLWLYLTYVAMRASYTGHKNTARVWRDRSAECKLVLH